MQAGYYNTTGSYDTFVGTLAGWNPNNDIVQYRITTDTNMVLVGYGATKDNAAQLDNSIAIGALAQVTKSNQVVLGNASITETLLRGNVGIGTTTPRLHLDILDTAAAQLRLTYTDNAVYADFLTDSAGSLTITPTGPTIALAAALSGTSAIFSGALSAASLTTAGALSVNSVSSALIPTLTDTYDLGSATKLWRKGWLSELDAVLFAENTVSVIGGWLMVAHNEGLIPVGQDVGSGDATIDFGQAMTVGDFVIFRAALQVEYVSITSLSAGTRYNVTRDLDGTGANAWPAGSVYVVLGQTGAGRIELNSNATPRISLITQGATYNAQTELIRIGDLNGAWGYGAETYGLAMGQYGVASKTSLTMDDTNGIRLFNNTTLIGQWDASGNILVGRAATASQSSVYITAGAIQLRNGVSNTVRISLAADGSGYLANSLIAWDASGNLAVTGNATIAGWSISATQISSGTTNVIIDSSAKAISLNSATYGAAGIQLQYNAGTPRAYIGNGTTKYMQFDGTDVSWAGINTSLTAAGLFTASNAVLTGSITATSGAIGGWVVTASRIASAHVFIDDAGQYISLGTTPPTAYGANVGAFLAGGAAGGQLSLYADANNLLQWNGSVLTWKGANTALDASGNLSASSATLSGAITATSGSISGDMNIGTGGDMRSGATAVLTGNGYWLDYNAGTPRFRIGTVSVGALVAGIYWDGTTLNITGSITVTGGNAAKTDLTNVTGHYAGSASVGGSANDTVNVNAVAASSISPIATLMPAEAGANVTGTHTAADTTAVNGIAAATVQGGAARANLGLNSSGVLVTKVIPASLAAPSGAGLYLGSDFLGYYNATAWKTYMDNAGNFYLGGAAGALQWDGTTLTITGTVTATSGAIGGWTLGATSLVSGSGATTVGLDSGGTNPAVYAGSATPASAPFRVTQAGALTATNATITGAITATSGAIGGWAVTAGRIASSTVFIDDAGSYISLGATPPTAYGSNVGIFLEGANSGRLSIYKDANNYLQWDNAKLIWKGANTALDASGNLTASSATISGAITATSGAIGGWTVSATKIAATGIDIISGASAGLAFGATPPTSATVGTGIWLDRTGMYGLLVNMQQAKFDAVTGAITAGAGNVLVDANGISLVALNVATNRVNWKSAGVIYAYIGDYLVSLRTVANFIAIGDTSNREAINVVSAQSFGGQVASIQLQTDANSYIQTADNFGLRIQSQSNLLTGVLIGGNAGSPNAMLDVRGSGVFTGGLHVGTATGAATGDLKTSGNHLLAGGNANYMTLTPSANVAVTVTIPSATDTLANLTGTQTLSGKTLTSPTINGATLTGTLAGGTFTETTLTAPTIGDHTNAGHTHGNAAGGGSLATSITLTTPTIGDFSNAQHVHDSAAHGGVLALSPAIFAQTATVTINTTGAQTMVGAGSGSLTLAANALTAGKTIRGVIKGYGTSGSGGTLTILVTLGGVTVCTLAPSMSSASTWGFEATFVITCRTTGAGGTVFGQAAWYSGGSTLSLLTQNTATAAANTTGTLAIGMTANFSAGAQNVNITNIVVELI
jgi:hypothetical protein